MKKRTTKATSSAFRPLLSKVQGRVSQRLSEVLSESEARAAGQGPEVAKMVGAVRHLCERGGKRLRPALCVAGAVCADEDADWEPAIEAGVSLELLQAYFLIHDDWMDGDATRRGGPTAHVELGRALGSKTLGEHSAILAGDHAVALATAQMATLPISAARLKRCMAHFAEMQLAAVAGQQLDIVGKTRDPELTYVLKTASYTVRGPLLVGAEIGGASKPTLRALEAFSLPAGVAFQLRDDLLGAFEKPDATGKSRGGDLKEGKNTPLIHAARRLLDARDRQKLERVLGNRKATAVQVDRAIRALEACGARTHVEQRITELEREALDVLENAHITSRGRALLVGATAALARRSA